MPTFHRMADKTKAFFERLTRRRRSRNGNQDLTGYQEGQHARGSSADTKGGGSGPSLPIAGDGAKNVVRLAASGSEAIHALHASAHGGMNTFHGSVHVPSAVVSPHSTLEPSASPPVPSTQARLHDPPSTSLPALFDGRQPSYALQPPDQNARSLSSSPLLSNTPAHSPHAPSVTSNYFPNASGFSIGVMNNNVHNFGSSKAVFEYLEPHISHGAAHNSNERSDAPKCDPETRLAVQEDIVSWMRDGDGDEDPKQIMWLSGPAGSGKTAIAGSVAETCRKEGLLAATFFFSSFSGSEDRHSKRCVVSSLAQHLAEQDTLHEYKVQLLASIQRHPTIFHKCLSEQAQRLLIEPLRTAQQHGERQAWPKAILLDGLDEVLAKQRPNQTPEDLERAHEEDQLEILDVLLTLANEPAFPFRIFVASRPERVISEFFATAARTTTLTLFLDSKYEPDVDIERFLWSKFAGIRRRYRISSTSWPGQGAVDKMVEMSSGQFIVPATMVRHIEAGVPQRQLDDIMQLRWKDTSRRNPFAIVDALYTCILRRSPEPFLAAKWIRVYTSGIANGWNGWALFFRQLVEDVEGEFHHVLEPLSSLVSIPMADDTRAPLKIYHRSLSDFLSSRRRSGDFYLDGSSVEVFIANRCASVLRNNGPAVPLHRPSTDLPGFFEEFGRSALQSLLGLKGRRSKFIQSIPFDSLVYHSFIYSLVPMSENSKGELATCDVAWWTNLCLARSPYATTYFGKFFISAMYCGIHAHLCDPRFIDCHAACSHWRTGIIAEARALNWCVHELERVDRRRLVNLTRRSFDDKFKKMGEREDGSVLSCTICQPNLSTS